MQYYPVFLGSIAKSLPSTTVYAIGHLGQSLTTASEDPSAVATLREQVEAKIQFVDQLDEEYGFVKGKNGEGKVNLVLMGHSVGAWICCEVRSVISTPSLMMYRRFCGQVIKARPKLVSSIHLLFPTLSRMALSPNGIPLIRYGSSLLPVLGAFSSAFSYLPTSVMTRIVGVVTSQQAVGAKVTTGLVTSPAVVRNALSMAREEMDQIVELDRETLKEFGGRMRFYHAEHDGWVLESCIEVSHISLYVNSLRSDAVLISLCFRIFIKL